MAEIAPAPGGRVQRRSFIPDGGEQPVLTLDAIEQLMRFETFVEKTGLPPERVLLTPVVSIPLPVPVKASGGGLERWQVRPEMMWHPLFWMPERLALRYQYRVVDEANGGTDDDVDVESDEIWAMRVMYELLACGLYDSKDGTWLDVLAWYGIDIDDPIDLARVEMWQAGEPDDVLDSIDLSAIINGGDGEVDDETWALTAARNMSASVIPAQWSLTADSLLAHVDRQLERDGDTDEERRKLLSVCARVAAHGLRTLPPADEEDISATEFFTAVAEQSEDPDADSSYLMEAFRRSLAEIRRDYEPHVRGLSRDTPNDHEPYTEADWEQAAVR